MDRNLVYSKTPAGEEATLQRTRVVQRNLRMVLLQVDGQLNIAGLVEKIGNEALVLNALRELEKGGYIALSTNPPSVWAQSKQKLKASGVATAQVSPFSTFEPSKALPLDESIASAPSQFSTFGAAASAPPPSSKPESPPASPAVRRPDTPGLQERLAAWLAGLRLSGSRDLKPYRRVSWGKRIAVGVAGLLLAGVLALLFFPYNSYRPSIEAALGQALGVPVKVGSVSVQMYPRPAVVLQDVRLSESGAARVGTVFIPQLMLPTSSEKKVLREVILSDMALSADFAAGLPRLLESMRNSTAFAIEHISLKNVVVATGGMELRDLNGEIIFQPNGRASGVSLHTPDRSLIFHLSPAPAGAAVRIEGYGWKAGETSPYAFGAIAAKGVLEPGKLVLQQLELGVADGSFQGKWTFEWSQGFAMAGEGVVARAKLKQLATMLSAPVSIEGDVSGDLRIRGDGANWLAMWEAADANMSVLMERVLINGVDFGTATRRGVGQSIRGGASKFDRIKGNLRVAARQMTGSDMELSAGLVRAQGGFVARPDKSVEGLFHVRLESSVQPIRSSLRVSGTLPTMETAVVQ